MTSNQIAYAANLENVRHNQAMEDENQRHNIATEELTNDANTLTAEKNQITATYNSESLRIQEEYNRWYSNYMNATTREKLRLEAEGNSIKSRANDIDEAYKIRITDINQQEADVRRQLAKETELHNRTTEAIAWRQTFQDYWFKEKQVWLDTEKNRFTENYYTGLVANAKRGQDLTFDANILSGFSKSGFDLGAFGFKYSVKGLPLTNEAVVYNIMEKYGYVKENPYTQDPGKREEQIKESGGRILTDEEIRQRTGGRVNLEYYRGN